MSVKFFLLDVFADLPFQGTQIPVVVLEQSIPDSTKVSIASEFKQTETVFVEKHNKDSPFSVFNNTQKTVFGSHTILAVSYIAHELGLSHDEGAFSALQIHEKSHVIDSYIDSKDESIGTIQYKRALSPTIDTYTPELSRIAHALNIEEKHLSYSKYKPLLVSIDHPILIVPVTKAEHVLEARLNSSEWSELLSDIYASEIFMFSPGSVSGSHDFHGRLINPKLAPDEFPPIGKVMPEFIAYLSAQNDTAEGTHTFTIDRGSLNSRISVIHAEFDKHQGKETQTRIGGNVIKMAEGTLFI